MKAISSRVLRYGLESLLLIAVLALAETTFGRNQTGTELLGFAVSIFGGDLVIGPLVFLMWKFVSQHNAGMPPEHTTKSGMLSREGKIPEIH